MSKEQGVLLYVPEIITGTIEVENSDYEMCKVEACRQEFDTYEQKAQDLIEQAEARGRNEVLEAIEDYKMDAICDTCPIAPDGDKCNKECPIIILSQEFKKLEQLGKAVV